MLTLYVLILGGIASSSLEKDCRSSLHAGRGKAYKVQLEVALSACHTDCTE